MITLTGAGPCRPLRFPGPAPAPLPGPLRRPGGVRAPLFRFSRFWTPGAHRTDNCRVTSSFEFPIHAVPARLSDADRDRAVGVLSEGVAQGRLSHDTFLRRMELALAARSADELAALTADLGAERRPGVGGRLVGAVGEASAFVERLRRAWHTQKLPPLMLPEPGPAPLRIGREPGNGLRLSHDTVSRWHAELTARHGVWLLRDLGSTNGTTVNGRRVMGTAVVRAGDMVGFGRMSFRLTTR
ncbi:FHA domain-containing protein [Streptomyces clavuligerus]|uniref:FHA domain-containing protein n=1 Tax=Streptomyces clavuligerus TaxID=1901 RepID=E2PVW1_STRCL|nr:FHA domain-containing protein [Streptomyces clavuligerus]